MIAAVDFGYEPGKSASEDWDVGTGIMKDGEWMT